jgi:glyoxylase-like metal-dependent hydrolase (beta-lactamase superfamily II)
LAWTVTEIGIGYKHDMDYPTNGHVEAGGESAIRTVTLTGGTEVEVRKFSVGPMDNNAYLLVSEGEALLIDAANDADRIMDELGRANRPGPDAGVTLKTIMTTHGHRDHWVALAAVAAATGADVVYHAADDDMIPRDADRHVEDGETLTFGKASVTLIHNPGHTPGSTSVLLGDRHLFTGDTLFPGGPGNTFGDADAFSQIMESLETKLFADLDDDVWVYPGHGDDTTLGVERPNLAEWRERGW